jgi:hypothetical protein
LIPDILVSANISPYANAGLNQTISEGEQAVFNVSGSFDPDGNLTKYEFDFGDGTNYTWIPNSTTITGTDILVYVTQDIGAYNRTYFDEELPQVLTAEGFSVTISGLDQITELTPSILANYDQLWIMSTNFTSTGVFSPSEIDAIVSFQENGSGLLIMTDHTFGGASCATDANQISSNYGVTFSGIVDHGHTEIYPFIVSHPLCENVGSIWGHWSEALLTVTNPDVEVIAIHNGQNMIAVYDEFGEGKVVFDTAFVRMEDDEDTNHNIMLADNVQYAINIAKWLGTEIAFQTPPLIYHTYYDDGHGTDGIYTMNLTVTDDEGATDSDSNIVTVENVNPTISPFGPFTVNAGEPLPLSFSASDPGSDDLYFTWDWGDWTSDDVYSYFNDGIGPDPYPSSIGISPFSVSDSVQKTYDEEGLYIINLTVEDDDGGITNYSTNVTVIGVPPPNLFINISGDGNDVMLNWEPPPISVIDYYLIYRSEYQTQFDFNSVWINTSSDMEYGESTPLPLRTMWNDTNASNPWNTTNFKEQYYYIIRVVTVFGKISPTSRTVGKWSRFFNKGVSSFSLPLEPIDKLYVDNLTTEMGAEYIRFLNYTSSNWVQHDLGDGAKDDIRMRLGEGYEVRLTTETAYSFYGMPGAMISYNDRGFGFDATPYTGDAQNLSASVDDEGNVTLIWKTPENIPMLSIFWVYRSERRDGFWGTAGVDYEEVGGVSVSIPGAWVIFEDPTIALSGTEHYYMIVPIDDFTGQKGVTSYSVGVWVEEYLPGYDTMGIPLKVGNSESVDWYCDNIPETVGINYYDSGYEKWLWHPTRMPQGAFDPELEMTYGYQVSTSDITKFVFIGV